MSLVTVGLLLIAGSCGAAWLFLQQGAIGQVKVDELTPRAQEFIAADTSAGTGLWTEVDFGNVSQSAVISEGESVQTPCFSFMLPLRTLNHKAESHEAGCTFRARSLNPAGHLVVSSQAWEDLQTHTGYLLRRSNAETYLEHPIALPQWPESALFSDNSSIVAFGWREGTVYVVAWSELPNVSSEKIELVRLVLQSLEVKP